MRQPYVNRWHTESASRAIRADPLEQPPPLRRLGNSIGLLEAELRHMRLTGVAGAAAAAPRELLRAPRPGSVVRAPVQAQAVIERWVRELPAPPSP
jgi:hypothetical protein